jgi:hypothetical protein
MKPSRIARRGYTKDLIPLARRFSSNSAAFAQSRAKGE